MSQFHERGKVRNVLIIHSSYRSSRPSGENLTVASIAKVIESTGRQVRIWGSSTDDLVASRARRVRLGVEMLLGGRDITAFREAVSWADSVQIHNAFPVLGLAEISELLRSGKPVVRVTHNFRMSCLAGTHSRVGGKCFKCAPRSYGSGIRHGCYNDSKLASALVARVSSALDSLWASPQTRFVAISEFMRDYLIDVGFAKNRIEVIPNFVSERPLVASEAAEAVFVGRLSAEKGVEVLLETWRLNPNLPRLNVIGIGPLSDQVLQASEVDSRIKFFGHLDSGEVEAACSASRVLIAPAVWAEPFGRVVAEAYARGQFVVCTREGGMAEMVLHQDAGAYCEPTSESIAETVLMSLDIPFQRTQESALQLWSSRYSPTAGYDAWDSFYSWRLHHA